MMSVQELFYGQAEPVWIVNTTAAQFIRHHPQHKPDQYIREQRNSRQNNFQQPASYYRDPPSQMGYEHHQFRQSPPRQRLQHPAPQYQHNSIPQKNRSQQLTDQDLQYIPHDHNCQLCEQGPRQQRSQQYYYQNDQNSPPHNSPYLSGHQPSAPLINGHLYNNEHENFSYYARPETKVVKMKVPMCCEACEERVMVSLTSIRVNKVILGRMEVSEYVYASMDSVKELQTWYKQRVFVITGVQSVDCDLRKEKVTVIGSAAPADILKACKKLFKRSEMWAERYY